MKRITQKLSSFFFLIAASYGDGHELQKKTTLAIPILAFFFFTKMKETVCDEMG